MKKWLLKKWVVIAPRFSSLKKSYQNHVQKIGLDALDKGFDALLDLQKKQIGMDLEMADISIEGDIKPNKEYDLISFSSTKPIPVKTPLLNIGPKGFTGEKYGGSTYWDTEAYCFPFYMATKNESVAENLLNYRIITYKKPLKMLAN